MINTYNESSLHKTLKKLYSLNEEAELEVNKDGHIYDILTKDNTVIEIQTKNLSKLSTKIQDILNLGYKCKVVHPLIIKKTIVLKDKNGTILSKRKSPKTNSIYSLFEELTGIYPFLLKNNFELEVLLVNEIEIRRKTDKPVQSKNKKRRFLRDWIKENKELESILDEIKFSKADDYIALLPKNLPVVFSAKDLQKGLKEEKLASLKESNNAHLIIWVLSRMNILEYVETKNKSRMYTIKKDAANSYVFLLQH